MLEALIFIQLVILRFHNEPMTDEPMTVQDYITIQSIKHDIDVETSLRIAKCESNYDPHARNPNSSAKGVYQFLDGTFSAYCSGDVFNYRDNVDCFMNNYKKHPNWWVCK